MSSKYSSFIDFSAGMTFITTPMRVHDAMRGQNMERWENLKRPPICNCCQLFDKRRTGQKDSSEIFEKLEKQVPGYLVHAFTECENFDQR